MNKKITLLPIFILLILPSFIYASILEDKLFKAVKNNNSILVKKLIQKGADINAKQWDGRTILIEASYDGHFSIVKLLIENGANVNAKSKYCKTALHGGFHVKHLEMVKFLIKNGVVIDKFIKEIIYNNIKK